MLEKLKQDVFESNMLLPHHRLVTFTWEKDANEALHNAVVLEEIAIMALGTLDINKRQPEMSKTLLDKHYLRKHGTDAYYGQI